MPTEVPFTNPFRPGAGHMPPFLAGRIEETNEFVRLIKQDVILENMVLTGLRGVGKTVLLDTLKPLALEGSWYWVGTDLSESASLSEDNIATRLLADLAVVTSGLVISKTTSQQIGFTGSEIEVNHTLNFETLVSIYKQTPGLASDKIKQVLLIVWTAMPKDHCKGLIFAYDEAQNLADHSAKNEFPLSLLLDVFQSIQKQGIPFMLVLTGLPTLFSKLVDARTFAERMFHVVTLDRLNTRDAKDAILKPIEKVDCPVTLTDESVEMIVSASGGYPYFVQFICREVYDVFIQKISEDDDGGAPLAEIERKLDADFFAGRWGRATDRQRELMTVISSLENCATEFSVQEVVERSQELCEKPFSASNINQMLVSLANAGLVFKNRHGKYSFAVPLLERFIRRQLQVQVL